MMWWPSTGNHGRVLLQGVRFQVAKTVLKGRTKIGRRGRAGGRVKSPCRDVTYLGEIDEYSVNQVSNNAIILLVIGK